MEKFKVTVTRVDVYEIEIDKDNLSTEIFIVPNNDTIEIAKDLAINWMRNEDKYFKEGYGHVKELDADNKIIGVPYKKEDGEFGYPLPEERYTAGITIKAISQDVDYETDVNLLL